MLGKLEELVMLGVLESAPRASAANVYRAIVDGGGVSTAFGAVFTTLDRLEGKKLVKSEIKSIDTGSGRKDRKIYLLTGLGEKTLRGSLGVTNQLVMKAGLAHG